MRRHRTAGAGQAKSRGADLKVRLVQALVWTFAAAVFWGLAALAGEAGGFPSSGGSAERAATGSVARPAAGGGVLAAPATVAPTTTVAGARDTVVAAPPPEEQPQPETGSCNKAAEAADSLPVHRWTSFGLDGLSGFSYIMQMITSALGSWCFWLGALLWRIIANFMSFGYRFDMVCLGAEPINTSAGIVAKYAIWFLIPAWLVVLPAVIRRWRAGRQKGPAAAMRLLMGFLLATGMIFFFSEQSDQHRGDALAPYTAPWMAAEVQARLARVTQDLLGLGRLADVQKLRSDTAFYDTDNATAGYATCLGLDEVLYTQYQDENGATGIKDGIGAMQQVSRIWELSFVRAWQVAQFGVGTVNDPSASLASCRVLEARSGVLDFKKWSAYDKSVGGSGTSGATLRGSFILKANGSEPNVVVAWGACGLLAKGGANGDRINQWKSVTEHNGTMKEACDKLFSTSKPEGEDAETFEWGDADGPLQAFFFNGDDEFDDAMKDCKYQSCLAAYEFVRAWLGYNSAERFTQGLMALLIAILFLWSLGPMALGLMLISAALAALIMILGLSLILVAMGKESGKKLLKLTGAAAAGKFIFSLSLAVMMLLIAIVYFGIGESFRPSASPAPDGAGPHLTAASAAVVPGFTQQILQAAAPLIAMLIMRKITKAVGLGNITSLNGALAFAGAAAMKATGDKQLAAQGARMSDAIGRIGVGNKRLGSLDERWLARNMVNNPATRFYGRQAKRAIRPVTDRVKTVGQSIRAGVRQRLNDFQSLSPGKRAGAYAALLAGGGLFGALTGTLPVLMPALAAAVGADQGRWGRLPAGAEKGDGTPYVKGAAAGLTQTYDWRTADRQNDNWHRVISRTGGPEREALERGYLEFVLNNKLGLQMGGTILASGGDREMALDDVVKMTGLSRDQIVMGSSAGIWVPAPAKYNRETRRMEFAPGTTAEQAGHWIHWIPEHLKHRKEGESADAWLADVLSYGIASGGVARSGHDVNQLLRHGLDARLLGDREQIMELIANCGLEEMAQFKLTSRRSDNVMRGAAHAWMGLNQVDPGDLQLAHVSDHQVLMEAAAVEIEDLKASVLTRPHSGQPTTFGTAQAEFAQYADRLEKLNEQLYRLYLSADAGSDAGQAQIQKLAYESGTAVQRIEERLTMLLEGLHASEMGRGVCEAQAMLIDPANADLDERALNDMFQRIAARLDQHHGARQNEIDTLLGAIQRLPHGHAGAVARGDSLRKLVEYLQNEVGDSEGENQRVLSEFKQYQDRIEQDLKRYESDQRRQAAVKPLARAKYLIAQQRGHRSDEE